MHHPTNTQQFADDHRAALQHAGQQHQLAASKRRSWWSRRRTDPGADASESFELLRIRAAIPPPGTPAFASWASDFGHRIADDGLAASERQARTIAMLARRCGTAPAIVAIVIDRSQPMVARERAIGRLLVALAAVEPCTSSMRADSTAA